MKSLYQITFLIISFVIVSCDATILENPEDEKYRDDTNTTLLGQFQYIWKGINNSYVFWDIDTKDWDKVYKEFYPKFTYLDQKGQQGDIVTYAEIRELLEEMTSGFIDHHMYVKMSNPYDKYNSVTHNVGLSEIKKRSDYSGEDSYYDIENNIDQYYSHSIIQRGYSYYAGQNNNILYAAINGDVAYLKTNSCYLSKLDSLSVYYKEVFNLFKSEIIKKTQNKELKGIVLDFRGNGGGSIEDLTFWIQLLSEKPIVPYHLRGKSGLGKYDYQPWISYVIVPNEEKRLNVENIPIVTLINEFSASGGELCPAVINYLPNTHSIGARTMGAHGAVSTEDFCSFYSGSFNFHNGSPFNNKAAAVRIASNAVSIYNKTTGKYECFEGVGIVPDENIKIDADRLKSIQGDNQLDAALSYIYNKK